MKPTYGAELLTNLQQDISSEHEAAPVQDIALRMSYDVCHQIHTVIILLLFSTFNQF
jgi:hypothetical protein